MRGATGDTHTDATGDNTDTFAHADGPSDGNAYRDGCVHPNSDNNGCTNRDSDRHSCTNTASDADGHSEPHREFNPLAFGHTSRVAGPQPFHSYARADRR